MEEQATKIYVGNLEYSVTDDDLRTLCGEKGLAPKDVSVIMDRFTGRSKGFGFIQFETPEETGKAIESLDGYELKGRALRVSRAQKKPMRQEREGAGRNF